MLSFTALGNKKKETQKNNFFSGMGKGKFYTEYLNILKHTK
jgi:hypothetical protein